MHENREISSTPWSSDQGRSAKAISRTADVHVLEKSDCAVVPVNHPNKEGQPSAEVGEGRAWIVKNTPEPHAPDTERDPACTRLSVGVRQAPLPLAFTIRAVCVDAHVRICAGGGQ